MSNKFIAYTILFLTYLNSFSQSIPNDTIVKKDGTKIIENFKTIIVHNEYLITSKYELSMEKIKSINDNHLKKIAIPLKDIDKVINNSIYIKKRKFLNENDVIWESETNNHKRKVWVHSRSERKAVVLPNGKLRLLESLVEGKCDLYIDFIVITSAIDFNLYNVNNYYYVHRKNEWKSTLFKGLGEFIKTKRIDYFDDCVKAKEFIKTRKKLSQQEIIELVKLYNEYCDSKK
ncbi:hypothetical protein [Lacinutrix mariniflava]|uniref:hypothetical protein n=1 Tax=Lacinutrix mariniflava TaxID=342955 RepID=UPI0006E20F02|nr:hypothetical protein [Lacinutrix mariniflava]